ncbi:hypothetical protein CASFOL_036860 [Castilleja foliolosa]|uniref:KIB1-4 beta-propeller domain-containing protein n=1 Tax=Castilleja foliolosa TaxID=1961234 RepID=A0ABD3BP93_9LAMI
MSSPSFLFRSIFHRSSKYLISNNPISFSSLFRRRMSTTAAALPSIIQNSPPWLMLPPAFDGGAMNFNFYSLPENKVITLAGSEDKEVTDLMSKPNHHRVLRGSSHGWLALFNKQNLDLFLYNPISRRHIKLPPIHSLSKVSKVILSCSPDEENCRAVMIHGDADSMAFCCPGRSKGWTPIGPETYECVYSSEQELLFGLTNDDKLETWDIRDLSSPKMIKSSKLFSDNCSDEDEDEELERKEAKDFCTYEEHLVVAGHDLLNVTQYIMENVGTDGLYVDDCNDKGSDNCPHLTVDLRVYKYDPDERGAFTVAGLDGLALFVGLEGDTVALPASSFPGLKANSIYYTDTIGTSNWTSSHDGKCDEDAPFGGHDIGIFNYDDKTVSSCYYPCDVQSIQRILPSPMWFFPSS